MATNQSYTPAPPLPPPRFETGRAGMDARKPVQQPARRRADDNRRRADADSAVLRAALGFLQRRVGSNRNHRRALLHRQLQQRSGMSGQRLLLASAGVAAADNYAARHGVGRDRSGFRPPASSSESPLPPPPPSLLPYDLERMGWDVRLLPRRQPSHRWRRMGARPAHPARNAETNRVHKRRLVLPVAHSAHGHPRRSGNAAGGRARLGRADAESPS